MVRVRCNSTAGGTGRPFTRESHGRLSPRVIDGFGEPSEAPHVGSIPITRSCCGDPQFERLLLAGSSDRAGSGAVGEPRTAKCGVSFRGNVRVRPRPKSDRCALQPAPSADPGGRSGTPWSTPCPLLNGAVARDVAPAARAGRGAPTHSPRSKDRTRTAGPPRRCAGSRATRAYGRRARRPPSP